VSERQGRFGLKFSKDRPEAFSRDYRSLLGNYEVRLDQQQFEELLREMRNVRFFEQNTLKSILLMLSEFASAVRENADSTKVKSSSLKEARDFSKEIEHLLATSTQLTFSEIQEQLNITAPTLSSHLDKLASRNIIRRIVVGRNVMYRKNDSTDSNEDQASDL
jgi:DNA-binding transcriptional ArsR family regulator